MSISWDGKSSFFHDRALTFKTNDPWLWTSHQAVILCSPDFQLSVPILLTYVSFQPSDTPSPSAESYP
ncbi:hypothetical protein AAY473_010951 [Plecturocebus cupreus]